jgi:hypothetical protein
VTSRLVVAAALVASVAAAVAGTSEARAQGQSSGGEPAAQEAVEVTVVGKGADLDRLRALGGARTPAGVPLRWSRVDRFDPLTELLFPGAASERAPLRCWIDMTEARRVVLYFAARGGQRYLVRGVELSGRFDEIDRQSLAQVLELSISALLEGDAVGISRSEARVLLSRTAAPVAETAAPTVAVTAPPEAPRLDLSAAVFYAAEELGSRLPIVHGPGLDLALRRALDTDGRRRALGLWLTGQYQMPASATTGDVGVRLQTAAVRAGGELERAHLRARIGAGVDWVRVAPLAGGAGAAVALAPAHWSTSAVVTGALAWLITVGRRFELAATLSADLLPTSVHYDLQTATGPTPAFTPWRLRPALALALGF